MDAELQRRSALGCELVTETARSFGQVCLKVTGASMIPAIWPGDIITVRRHEKGALRRGQIVLYSQERRLVAHRITYISGDFFTTRGDALLRDDPPINESDIVGQIVSLVRNGRSMTLYQSSWQRAFSSVLRRSDFCLRMTLRLRHRLWRQTNGEKVWAN